MNPSTFFLGLASCLFISGSVFSQGNPGDWVYYNTANSGIPDNNVTSISADQDGFVWVDSKIGLLKFDGTSRTDFNNQNSCYNAFFTWPSPGCPSGNSPSRYSVSVR